MTLIFCVLLKLDRDDLEDELPGGMDLIGSALVFINTSVPGAALVVGFLTYGLGTVFGDLESAGETVTSNPLMKLSGDDPSADNE